MKTNGIIPGYLLALCIGILCLSGTPGIAAAPLDELLERTGRTVELFWQEVASFTSTELVIQEKIGKREKIEYKRESISDYLALTKTIDDALIAEELRLPKKRISDKLFRGINPSGQKYRDI